MIFNEYIDRFSLFIKKNRILIALIFLATLFYFFIIDQLGGFSFISSSLFSTGDSQEYLQYSRWIGGDGGYSNEGRTFFYPLLILASTKLAGSYGIWFLQFLLWLSACIIIYITVNKVTNNISLAIISFLLAICNISLVVYTAHALTEITAFFLLSLLSYLLSVSKGRPQKISFIFCLSVLVAVKPQYLIILSIFLLIILLVNVHEIIRKPLILLLVILSLSPVIIQVGINKIKHNTFSITQIADVTVRDYFYRKTKYFVENNTSAEVLKEFESLPESEVQIQKKDASQRDTKKIILYLLKNPKQSMIVYWDNLMDNFRSGNPYINNNHTLKKLSQNINTNFISKIHLVMFLFWIFFLSVRFSFFKTAGFQFILWNGILTFYLLFTSGITFWTGDRIIVSATSLCCILYPCMVYLFIRKDQLQVTPKFEPTASIHRYPG